MKPFFRFLPPAVFVALCVALAGCDRNPAEKHPAEVVSAAQVPAAVQATLNRQSQNGNVKQIEKLTRNGKTFYRASVLINGQEQKFVVAEDGALIVAHAGDDDDDD
ncbi:hypothetical protein [Burkholderia sp. NLJ2]|uniref:hypothetical protein n=1 Tax=Burkholderia sp. NLJ2 TaxID=3090699 RepID=UPI003C6C0D76